MEKQSIKWSINNWCSHPDDGNDDCNTGGDFDSLEDAKASKFYTSAPYYIMFIEIDGPIGSDYYRVIKNPNYSAKRVKADNRESEMMDRSERAMQAGMLGGCEAYNEEMGY
jgi:hypothetical protein